MEKIKIIHVIRPADGGMKEHLLSLIRQTNKQRYDISVACPREGTMADEFAQEGLQVIPLDLKGEISPKRDIRVISTLIRIFWLEKPGIVHCHGSKAGLVGRLAAFLAGVPVIIFTAHNSIFYDFFSGWKKKLFAVVERFLSLITDRIIAVSGAIRSGLVEKEGIKPTKITTIYNGVNTGLYQDSAEIALKKRELGLDNGFVVGIVARLAPQKGVNYFLVSAVEILKEFPDCSFVIIGEGPLRSFLEKLAFKLGVAHRVKFLGYRKDVADLLPVFDVFTLSSLTEGLPLTVLEAMAAGRPVVATKVGGIPEIINSGYSGLLVEPKDSHALAQAVISLLRDPEKATALGNAGRRLVQKRFSIDSMVDQTCGLYSQLLVAKGLLQEEDNPVLG